MGFTRAEAFPSKWLNAEAFKPANGGPRTLTIREVTQEVVKGDEDEEKIKYVVWFEEEKRGLGLNVTNWLLIEAMYGDDTDNWLGKTIKLHATKVPFGKGLVDAVRVLAPDVATATAHVNPAQQVWAKFYLTLTDEQKLNVNAILGGSPSAWMAKAGKDINACIAFVKAAFKLGAEPVAEAPKDEIPF